MPDTVATTCPYCGVGCGVLAVTEAGTVSVKGDPNHPANFGRLCSKGAALADTLGLEQRLLQPRVDGQPADWETALTAVADQFSETIRRHGPDSVAFYVSGQLLNEDYYVANKLMKGFIGSANIDTNSRLCMSSSVAGHQRAFGSDSVPCCYDDLEAAELVVLTGSNTAWCHPVLYQRIVAAKKTNAHFKIVVIDPRRTDTCDRADMHLPVKSGTDAILFNGLFAYLAEHGFGNDLFIKHCTQDMDAALSAARAGSQNIEQVADLCALSPQAVLEFYSLFAQSERVVTVYSQGINQSSSGTDKVNAILNCHLYTGRIGRKGMGPFSFTGQPNAMGGREVGGLANQLAAHMAIDNAQHRDTVRRFWNAMALAGKPGLKAVDLFQAVQAQRVKALWIMATNPVVSLPEADAVRAALEQCEFVVVSDCYRNTDTNAYAHVLLPALAWGEKDGTVTNSERRISRQRPFLPEPGEARADWWIVCEVAKRMGFVDAFSFQSPAEIFAEHAALSGFENNGQRNFDIAALSKLDPQSYDRLAPVQWPVKADGSGTARLFGDGVFYTPNRLARFIPITPRPPAHGTDHEYPLILNTGRVRDQWHTMTRTGDCARLSAHSPEPAMAIHPLDATRFNIEDQALSQVQSRHGKIVVRAQVSRQQSEGSVFIPMHWTDQFASLARVDTLIQAVVDPISGQPEFKHTPVRVAPYQAHWHGFLLSRRDVRIRDASYWVKTKNYGCYRYEIAGEQAPKDWSAWARSHLCQSDKDVHWVEYLDVRQRRYRGVRLVGNTLESCLFIAPNHALPSRDWLSSLFTRDKLQDHERASLLTGQPGRESDDAGPVVCACFRVGINTLRSAIKDKKLKTVEDIGKTLQAGTNCGSCVPELRKLLAD